MSKVLVATICLSSKNMGDLRNQINELMKKNQGDGATYEVGEYYEPVPGYVSVDIFKFLPAEVVQFYNAVDSFESDPNETEKIH
jgi:hypothetical protein